MASWKRVTRRSFNPLPWVGRQAVHGLLALDHIGNWVTGGTLKETISKRMARWRSKHRGPKKWVGGAVCSVLDLADRGHCRDIED